MKKILSLSIILTLLTGCAETLALLGPATGGNLTQSAVSSAVSFGVKKKNRQKPHETCNGINKKK